LRVSKDVAGFNPTGSRFLLLGWERSSHKAGDISFLKVFILWWFACNSLWVCVHILQTRSKSDQDKLFCGCKVNER